MASNQFERHRKARKRISALFDHPEKLASIHYSRENFYDLPDGRSPRITSIAVRNLNTGQTDSFSIHQMAELQKLPLTREEIEKKYDELEKKMLCAFFNSIKKKNRANFYSLEYA